ncbi:MAG: LapA family protein [Solirubrobacteraceae bacterium]
MADLPSSFQPAAKGDAAPRRHGAREVARTGVFVVIAVLITLFAVFNLGEVKVDWIFGSGNVPLIVVIVVSLAAGVLLTYGLERLLARRAEPRKGKG